MSKFDKASSIVNTVEMFGSHKRLFQDLVNEVLIGATAAMPHRASTCSVDAVLLAAKLADRYARCFCELDNWGAIRIKSSALIAGSSRSIIANALSIASERSLSLRASRV